MLYIAYGQPGDAFSVPIDVPDEEIYLRVESGTHRIVGLDIMHFRKKFLALHDDAKEAFDPFFNLLGHMDWRIQLKAPGGDEEGQIALLLPASASLEYFPRYIPKVAPDLVPA